MKKMWTAGDILPIPYKREDLLYSEVRHFLLLYFHELSRR